MSLLTSVEYALILVICVVGRHAPYDTESLFASVFIGNLKFCWTSQIDYLNAWPGDYTWGLNAAFRKQAHLI